MSALASCCDWSVKDDPPVKQQSKIVGNHVENVGARDMKTQHPRGKQTIDGTEGGFTDWVPQNIRSLVNDMLSY